jgi:hypothetical protein
MVFYNIIHVTEKASHLNISFAACQFERSTSIGFCWAAFHAG